MKKIVAAALAFTLALAMFGCSTGGDNSTAGEEANEGLKIALVSSPSGVDDGSFNQDNYNGIQQFIAENPSATVTPIREQNEANAIAAVEAIVADYDVIVTPGFQFAGIVKLAQANPEKKFILVDAFPTNAAGDEVEVANIYAMQFAEQESGFFAGIAAALESKTGKVASVHGMAYPSNVNYQFGFESGVNYANKHLGTKTQVIALPSYAGTDVTGAPVGGNYAGSFSDEATGKIIGDALLAEGVDIIFVAAGATGNGVFTAVKEHPGTSVIGCDVDQSKDGDIVISSGLKIMAPNVYKQLNNVQNGSFKGLNEVLTATSDSTGLVTGSTSKLSADTVSIYDEVYNKVKSGDIVPASNFNGSKPDSFKGL